MAAANYDIIVEQGSDFLLGLLLKNAKGVPFDLTGVIARGQLRANVKDSAPLCSFDITFDQNRSTGKLTLFIPAAVTTTLDFVNGFYDLEFESSTGMIKRIMQGKVTFSPEITRVA
jgi:hypothetical protein